MRAAFLACAAAFALIAFVRFEALAASSAPAAPIGAPHSQAEEIDDNDDTRVEVQLVVLGIAAGTVCVAGSGVYLLRKRLGLVAPPPDQDAGAHH